MVEDGNGDGADTQISVQPGNLWARNVGVLNFCNDPELPWIWLKENQSIDINPVVECDVPAAFAGALKWIDLHSSVRIQIFCADCAKNGVHDCDALVNRTSLCNHVRQLGP